MAIIDDLAFVMKLSIIIPAYNASKTLPRCMDSIFAVGLEEADFEVIAVDDCSTDNTLELLQEYSERHSNVRVLHQTVNKRQGAARNRAIAEADGEYIAFVDADDTVMDGIVKALDYAITDQVDMLFCATAWENGNHEFVPREYNAPVLQVMQGNEFAERYYDVVCVGPWTYLWRRTFLCQTNIPFIENRRMEDFDFIEKHIVLAKKIAYSSSVIYNYHINQDSTVRTTNCDTVADWVHVCYRRWKFCETLPSTLSNFVGKIDFQCRCFVSSSLSVRRFSRFSGTDVKTILKRIGAKELKYLYSKGRWPWFTKLCMNHGNIVVIVITVAHPMAVCARFIVRFMRKAFKQEISHE